MSIPLRFVAFAAAAVLGNACGEGSPGTDTGDVQTPPTISSQAITDWIATGSYLAWHCESAPHEPRDPSPHGNPNRICSNEVLSSAGAGAYPIGSANVKELYEDGHVTGHAVYVKDVAGGGEAFLWYEAFGTDVVAFGHGDSGKPKFSCVGCHENAGPSHFGHDFVFTQVH